MYVFWWGGIAERVVAPRCRSGRDGQAVHGGGGRRADNLFFRGPMTRDLIYYRNCGIKSC